jgi:very-short-patch-repair endonuclease
VEADGSQRGENLGDRRRDAYLARQGWTVLRFWNHDISQNRESVIDTILARAGLPW